MKGAAKMQADCLQRALVALVPASAEWCIATVVSRGFGAWLDDWLGALFGRGECEDALVVVFVTEDAHDCFRVLSEWGKERPLLAVPIRPMVPVTPAIKGVMYSVARFVEAQHYMCLEADALVLDSLRPLRESLTLCRDAVLTVRGQGLPPLVEVDSWIANDVGGTPTDLRAMIGPDYAPWMKQGNGGLICGGRDAMLALDAQIRGMMPYASEWVDARGAPSWRDEWVFNLALHAIGCNVSIAPEWNAQLHWNTFARGLTATGSGSEFRVFMPGGVGAKVLHFVGGSKQQFRPWRGHFSRFTPETTEL